MKMKERNKAKEWKLPSFLPDIVKAAPALYGAAFLCGKIQACRATFSAINTSQLHLTAKTVNSPEFLINSPECTSCRVNGILLLLQDVKQTHSTTRGLKNKKMKKTIFMMLAMPVLMISSAFANPADGINDKAISSFNQEFALASNAKWEAKNDFSKVTFTLNSQVMFAYYGGNGELIAVTRNISSTQLPLNLLTRLKRDYQSGWITDLFEISNSADTSYYITLEDGDNTIVLKSANGGNWEVFKKTKK